MSLEVAIEKQVSGFRLDIEFTANSTPLGLLGPSGSGKTMTLRTIAGLDKPDRGRIVLHGRVLFDSAHGINVPARERRIGLLFQNYALFPHLTVAQNIAFGLRRVPEPERALRVQKQLAAVHLDHLARRYPASLSGGEQQRVALARALAVEPAALLLDEPFSALDALREPQSRRGLPRVWGTCGARGRKSGGAGIQGRNIPPTADAGSRASHGMQEFLPRAPECGWICRSARLGLRAPRDPGVRKAARARGDSRAPYSRARIRNSGATPRQHFPMLARRHDRDALPRHTRSANRRPARKSRRFSRSGGGFQTGMGIVPQSPATLASRTRARPDISSAGLRILLQAEFCVAQASACVPPNRRKSKPHRLKPVLRDP